MKRHYSALGYNVRIARIHLGNTEIDGEVVGEGWKIALEIKSPGDDLTRGLGQLAEALAFGYTQSAIVTTLRKAKQVDPTVFEKLGLMLLGVNSSGKVQHGSRYWRPHSNCCLGEFQKGSRTVRFLLLTCALFLFRVEA